MNTVVQQAASSTQAPDGIYHVNPESKPPKGFKQLCNACGFDRFRVAYHYCPNCGSEAVRYSRYVRVAGGK